MKVVLAEKPSVGRDIAKVLGAVNRREGYMEGNGWAVTWAIGHLVTFAEPNDYEGNWQGRWSFEQLPMIPDHWMMKPISGSASQYHIVKRLITDERTQEIICATDAGREGENIFRLIYEFSGCNKPFRRLWVSSLTDEAIADGFKKLQAGSDFDDLAAAARARTQADWLVGLNLTRAYTVHNRTLLTIGRVQTPTLAMIVARDLEIENFTKAYYYEIEAHFHEGLTAKYRNPETNQYRIDSKVQAERLHRVLQEETQGLVKKVEIKMKRNRPPAPYDLITLQKEANKKLGLTASQVLEHAQKLYETYKVITYPRTESRYLPEDMVPQFPQILSGLPFPEAQEALTRLKNGHKLGKNYVDRTKLTDHHGIVPTGKQAPQLAGKLAAVYEMIARRFIGLFFPDQEIEETTVTVKIGAHIFIARGNVELQAGWTKVEPRKKRKDESDTALPALEKNQTVNIKEMNLLEKETNPPKPFTDAALLTAMKNAGREIEDDALAEAMKQTGLGTPATRAEIIEKLIRTHYVERRKKNIVSTEKGRSLIQVVAEPLKSPELTGKWEQRLKDVEDGAEDARAFYDSIVKFVVDLIPRVSHGATIPRAAMEDADRGPAVIKKGKPKGDKPDAALGVCPACAEGWIIEGQKAFGCTRFREGCPTRIPKTLLSKELDRKQVKRIISKGSSEQIEGFISRKGKPFSAWLYLDGRYRVGFSFEEPGGGKQKAAKSTPSKSHSEPESDPSTCPKCGQGRIIEGKKGFGCNRFREGCDFVIWKENGGKSLTDKQRSDLISKGKTGTIKGFEDESGNKYDGRLVLDNQKNVLIEKVEEKKEEPLTCPKCGQGTIIEGQKGYGCDRFRQGCRFVIWKTYAGKTLTAKQLKKLVEKGKSGKLKGFQDDNGEKFDGELILSDQFEVLLEKKN